MSLIHLFGTNRHFRRISKRLGHSNTATTTKHYARPIAGRDFKVANNLDQQFNAVGNESRAAS